MSKVNKFRLSLLIIFVFVFIFSKFIFKFFFWHNPELFPFLDLQGRLSHIDLSRLGYDTYAQPNFLDPLGRTNDKPSISLLLSSIGIGLKDHIWIGSILIIIFIVQMVSLLRDSKFLFLILASLWIIGPNSLFAIERCNDDIVVFIVSFGLPYLIDRSNRYSKFVALFIVWILGAIKYYPLSLYFLLINKYSKINILITTASFVLWLKLFLKEYLILKDKLPLNNTNIGGFSILDIYYIANGDSYDITDINRTLIHFKLIIFFILGVLIISFLLLINNNIQIDLKSITEIDKYYFLIGSSMLVFCYLASTNNGYRMIHSIFLLPLILTTAKSKSWYLYQKISFLSLVLVTISNLLILKGGGLLILKVKILCDFMFFIIISSMSCILLKEISNQSRFKKKIKEA